MKDKILSVYNSSTNGISISNRLRKDSQKIRKLVPFLKKQSPLLQYVWHIINDVNQIPKCQECGKNVKWLKDKSRYTVFCSRSCSTKNDNTKIKKEKSCFERYGVSHFGQSTEHSLLVSNYHNNLSDIEKKNIKNKQCKAFTKNHGVKWISQSESAKKKRKETMFNRYGTLVVNNFGRWKEYKMPDGKIIKVQGYEHIALDILLQKYNIEDIIISTKHIRNICGNFLYLHEGIERNYLPDLYVIPERKMLEIKSDWTYDRKGTDNNLLSINLSKKQAVINKGYMFEFWILDKNGKLIIK